MHDFLDILKYTIPSLIVMLSSWLLLKTFFSNQMENRNIDLKKHSEEMKAQLKGEDKKLITPIRLQAYERLALYLERISPQSSIFRVQKPGQTALQLQSTLLKNIRDEFEHNLSQQLYVSSEVWSMVKTSKEEIVKLINTAAAEVNPDSPAYELSTKIFESTAGHEKLPTDKALEMLKKEIRNFY